MRWLASALIVLLSATTFWLWRDNARLRAEHPAPAPSPAPSPAAAPAPAPSAAPARLLGAVARVLASPAPSTASPDAPRRRMRDLLGRIPGESDDGYRARVMPLVTIGLANPRARVEDRRHDFEAAAQLTPEQQGELDRALDDARNELVALANSAITAGDLTPYRKNVTGVAHFLADAAAIAGDFDQRVRGSLSGDQNALFEQSGFDLVEYLGFTTPWERLTPPPPAP